MKDFHGVIELKARNRKRGCIKIFTFCESDIQSIESQSLVAK